MKCELCSATKKVTYKGPHDPKDLKAQDKGDGTHIIICGACGTIVNHQESHVYKNGKCEKCGAKIQHLGSHKTIIRNRYNLGHDTYCTECKVAVSDVVNHTYLNHNTDTIKYDLRNGNGHGRTCTRCSYSDFSPHVDKDNDGKCDECYYFSYSGKVTVIGEISGDNVKDTLEKLGEGEDKRDYINEKGNWAPGAYATKSTVKPGEKVVLIFVYAKKQGSTKITGPSGVIKNYNSFNDEGTWPVYVEYTVPNDYKEDTLTISATNLGQTLSIQLTVIQNGDSNDSGDNPANEPATEGEEGVPDNTQAVNNNSTKPKNFFTFIQGLFEGLLGGKKAEGSETATVTTCDGNHKFGKKWEKFDEQRHIEVCEVCGAEGKKKASHSMKWVDDGNEHVRKCESCSYVSTRGEHELKLDLEKPRDKDTHTEVCSKCKLPKSVKHTFENNFCSVCDYDKNNDGRFTKVGNTQGGELNGDGVKDVLKDYKNEAKTTTLNPGVYANASEVPMGGSVTVMFVFRVAKGDTTVTRDNTVIGRNSVQVDDVFVKYVVVKDIRKTTIIEAENAGQTYSITIYVKGSTPDATADNAAADNAATDNATAGSATTGNATASSTTAGRNYTLLPELENVREANGARNAVKKAKKDEDKSKYFDEEGRLIQGAYAGFESISSDNSYVQVPVLFSFPSKNGTTTFTIESEIKMGKPNYQSLDNNQVFAILTVPSGINGDVTLIASNGGIEIPITFYVDTRAKTK